MAQENEEDTVQQNQKEALRIPTRFGNYLVGANLVFANATFQKGFDASYNAGIEPKVALFILPNIALGLNLDFSVQGNKSSQTINYSATPFTRIYFSHNNSEKPLRPLQFFVEAGIGYGGTNSWYESNGSTIKAQSNGFSMYGMPGIDYFLNKHIATELGLEYHYIGGIPKAHVIGLNIGFQIFL